MTPAEELRTAATKLRKLVTDLGDCRGPWYVVNRDQRPYPQRIDNIGVPYVVASTTTDPSCPPMVADYIAAMHPGAGRALAELLANLADFCDSVEDIHGTQPDTDNLSITDALAVARAINGGQP